MEKNNCFLWGVLSAGLTILFSINVLTFLSLTYINDNFSFKGIFTLRWYIWAVSSFLVLGQNVFFGILQIKNPGREQKIYVGYLTIFTSFLVFPFFVSLEFYNRSGLSRKEINKGIRRWIVNNFDFFYQKAYEQNEDNLISLSNKYEHIDIFLKLKVASLRELNEYKLDLLEKILAKEDWPEVWNEQEILNYYGK